MKGLPFVLLFTAMTFLSWGAYGPVLHHGAVALEHDSMRAFVGVGLAYFLIAVIIPFFMLKKSGEKGKWTLVGTVYSLVAGTVGAIGALGIILALGYGGRTVYVMPLVFGFAPVVNTLVTAALSRSFGQIKPVFIGGIVAAALGAAGVLFFKPAPPANSPESAVTAEESDTDVSASSTENQTPSESTTESATPADDDSEPVAEIDETTEAPPGAAGDGSADEEADGSESGEPDPDGEEPPTVESVDDQSDSSANVLGIVLSIITAALCWGSYGPMLHIGQARMEGSRMRPFMCVGMAYFVIGVAVPLVLIASRANDAGAWNLVGMTWSFLAGTAGAIGALGVILAFNAGGKPYYVMPLIFGFAPVINTFISLTEAGTWSLVKPMFWVSLGVVIAGAVTVLVTAPKSKPKPKPEAA